ncbi:MAG: DUF4836 family protein [Parafilimonas sp.]|nr:DUF4836 family protein [Parafilimonas sp.]
MKHKLSAFVIIVLAIITFATCKKPVPDLALYVPKDASFVLTIDPKSIMDKIESSGITIDSLANLFAQKNDAYALRWDDIKNSGIDLTQPIYVFVKGTNSIQSGSIQNAGIIAKVQDASKLEAFLKKEKVGANVLSGDKYKYIALGNDFVAGWTDKVLIMSAVSGGNSSPGSYSTGEGTLSQKQLTTLFTQNESASIASVDGFTDMLSKNGDIHYYTNTSSNLNTAMIPGMAKANTLLQGSYGDGTIDFEKGKISATGESHYGKDLADILQKYPARSVDKSMLSSYPDSISGFGIFSFNPKMLIDILHYLGVDMMADSFMTNLGFSTNDVVNAFSGDVAAIFSQSNNLAMGTSIHGANFIVNMRIGDKTAFDKVMTGLVNKRLLSKNGDQYQLGSEGGHGFVIETTGNALLIGSSDELIKAYEAGSGKASLPADIDKNLGDKSMALFVDINSIFNKTAVTGNAGNEMLNTARTTFKDFVATTNKSDGKIIKGNFELNLINQNENSLASLVKFIAAMHKQEMQKKEDKASIFMDSIPTAPNDSDETSQ